MVGTAASFAVSLWISTILLSGRVESTADRWVIAAAAATAMATAVLTCGAWWVGREDTSRPRGGGGGVSGVRQEVRSSKGVIFGPGSRTKMRNVRIDLRAADQPTGASRDESEVERPKGLVRLGEIPNESQGFQPRDYLLEPLRSVGSAQGTAVVRALVGPRGVGKTQLAAAYARECLVQRWPVVAWIALEDPGQLVAGLAELGERLGLRGADDDAEATARAVRMWLQDDPGLNLVVIDSVENVDEVAPWLPAGGTARIVITTTSQAVANLAEALSVDVFSIEESVAYLARQSGVAGWE